MRQGKLETLATRAAVFVDVIQVVGLLALVVAGLLILAVSIVPAAEQPAEQPGAVPASAASDTLRRPVQAPVDSFAVTADTSLVFVLQVGSRLYPEWKEERRVHLGERFVIGDTDNAAVVTKLLPDFRIAEGGPRSVTPLLANPAVRIFVYQAEARTDSAWAFLNFPPHFSPKSFFTFQLKEVVGYAAPGDEAAPAAGAASPAAADDQAKGR